jgi:hypothetical protein
MAVTRLLHPNLVYAIHSDTDSENTAQTIEEGPLTLHSIDADNEDNASPSYVKIYDSDSVIVVGTTVPDYVFLIPASTRLVIEIPGGVELQSGAQVATVTAGGTGGTTSPTSSVPLRVTYSSEVE